jgi:hypothetical protein
MIMNAATLEGMLQLIDTPSRENGSLIQTYGPNHLAVATALHNVAHNALQSAKVRSRTSLAHPGSLYQRADIRARAPRRCRHPSGDREALAWMISGC